MMLYIFNLIYRFLLIILIFIFFLTIRFQIKQFKGYFRQEFSFKNIEYNNSLTK